MKVTPAVAPIPYPSPSMITLGETAAGVARWLFLAFLPLALIGCASLA